MTTQAEVKTALADLAVRCGQATGPDRVLSAEIALAVHDWLHEVEGNKPLNCRVRNKSGSPVYIGGDTGRALDFTASLDAAMTLVPEGCGLQLFSTYGDEKIEGGHTLKLSGLWEAYVYTARDGSFNNEAATPALALCAAALRARAAA